MKTLHNFKLLAITVLLAAGLAACDKQPGPAETAGKMIDETTADAGKTIGDAADKVGEKIEATTETIGEKIDATTDKVGEKMSEQSDKTAVAVEDTEITAKVKAAIFAEPGLSMLQISVETVNGVVTLNGTIDSQANIDRARDLASAVSGVKGVDNKLVLKAG